MKTAISILLRCIISISIVSSFVLFFVGSVYADGTESLGIPNINIAQGSGMVAAGTGLIIQPGEINIEVPQGVSIKQVLLYWQGEMENNVAGDNTINVNGNPVGGTLIGGPTHFFTNAYSSSFRADITGLELISQGANTLHVEGLEFTKANNGAGVLVIFDDGFSTAEIDIRDGIDLAFIHFPEPRKSTVKQTYTFEPTSDDREAKLLLFASSVQDGSPRPNSIEITVNGFTEVHSDILNSNNGMEWDTVTIPVVVPAHTSTISVQVFSRDDLGTGYLPASLAWILGGFYVMTEHSGGGEGLTPGFWKQAHHFDWWENYAPTDDYETIFQVDASFKKDLLGALKQGGGEEKALGRHAVAGLLNAASSKIDYLFSEAEVISIVQEAYNTGDFEAAKDLLEEQNELGTREEKQGLWCGDFPHKTGTLCVSTGGCINFLLIAGLNNANRNYVLLGSVTGTDPGTPLPGGKAILPLNWDVFTGFIISRLNTPVFGNFRNSLDPSGTGTAQLNAPPLPGYAGVTMHFAFALNNPWDFVSNPVAIDIVP